MRHEHTLHVGRFLVTSEFTPTPLSDGLVGMTSDELGRLEIQAATAILSRVESINGDELRFARKAMSLRQPDLATLLDVAVETVSRWETGADPIRRQTQLAVLHLLETTARTGSPTPISSLESQDNVSGFHVVLA